jgi:uncharacterized protein (DUF2336 family)
MNTTAARRRRVRSDRTVVWANRIFGGRRKARAEAERPVAQPGVQQRRGGMHQLVDNARRPDQASRSKLVQQLSDICLASGKQLSEAEKEIFFDILRHMIHRIEMRVRQSIAERLAIRPDAPHDLIFQLANDHIEVALPVLAKSMVLEDADLIELILNRTEAHQAAIAQRPEVSVSVTETLIETGNEDVITTLLRNPGAQIMPDSMARIVDDSLEIEAYRKPLLHRRDMSPALAQRMYTWVGEALREYINDNFDVSEDAVNDTVSLAIAEAIHGDISGDDELLDLGAYASEPHYDSAATLLIQALSDGDIYHFEEIIRDMTDLTAPAVTRLLYDSTSEVLAIAFRAMGLDRTAFSEIFCHLRGSRPYESFLQSPMHEKAMAYFDRISYEDAERVLASWRLAPDDPNYIQQ